MENTFTEALEVGSGPLSVLRSFLPEFIGSSAVRSTVFATLITTAFLFIVITAILFYHWKKYAVRASEYLIARTVYSIVALGLWVVIAATAAKIIS